MTPERWARIRRAVEAALDADPSQRTAILESTCDDEAERAEALALLEHDDADLTVRSPCNGAAEDVFAALEAQRHIGRTLGAYRLTSLIAAGGMGDVYKAERTDGAFQSTVAVKLVRAGGSEARRRFARERRTLARLHHPAIARLIDAGEEDGAAYLVMEFVDGRPLLDHCRDLPVAERVRIMRDVCIAVAHAHRALVVHRDLKPANILVTPDGEPRLLDFGISKLLAATDEPALTSVQLFTPRYAAPEQICAEPVTTATDVYALGVVLYEVLADAHWPERTGVAPWERRPARPSTANPTIDRELDAIVLQAAATDPDERYPSADALRDDLDRYLSNRPVRALPASRTYAARKWAARHKPAITAACIIAVLLVAAIVAPTALALRLTSSQRRTLEATHNIERINSYLHDTIRAAARTEFGGNLTLNALLDDALARLHELDDADPGARAGLRLTLASSLNATGRVVDAESQFRLAVADYRAAGARDGEQNALLGHGMALRDLGRLVDAKARLHELITLDPPRNVLRQTHNVLAFTYATSGEFDAAEEHYRVTIDLSDSLGDEIASLDALAEMCGIAGRASDGVAHRRRIVHLVSEHDPVTLAHARVRLARSLRMAGEFEESVAVARLSLEGIDPADADFNRVELAMSLEAAGDPEQGLETLRSAVDSMSERLPPDFPTVVYYREWLGLMLTRHDRHAEALPIIRAVHANYTDTLGPDHQRTRYANRALQRIESKLAEED